MLDKEIEEYLDYRRRGGLGESSLSAYRADLMHFLQFAVDMGCAEAEEISGSMLSYYLDSRRRDGIGERTIARQISCLRGFYRYLIRGGRSRHNPADELRAGQEISEPHSVRIPGRREIERLIAQPDPSSFAGLRDQTMLRILCESGVRAGELAAMQLQDVDLRILLLTVNRENPDVRTLPVSGETGRVLTDYLRAASILFPSRQAPLFPGRSGLRMSRQNIWKTVCKYARQAGLGNIITPSSLRLYAAAASLQDGIDPETVRIRMGYESDYVIRLIQKQIGQQAEWRRS
ncbi:MAG: tyrosine-type recombinase/integrase [Lachnospiraceae bacterium]|nr:tyrosine-type recombinase/integrase [Lachnospiraceae bacterium]